MGADLESGGAVAADQNTTEALKDRLRTLSAEKVYLDIVMSMIHRLGGVSGLENVARAVIVAVSETIGGEWAAIYYTIGDEIFRVSSSGGVDKLPALDDPKVSEAIQRRQPIEVECPAGETGMLTSELSRAWTWICPLVVGDEAIGACKVENLHLGVRGLMRAMPLFFEFAALIIKNEILSQSNLKRAFDELHAAHEELITVRNRLEEEVRERGAALRDLTQANRQLGARTAELEHANRELASFYRTASHDLRTPLRAVEGFSRLLLDDYAEQFDDEGRRLLAIVRKNAVYAARLIDDLLAFSRLSQMEMRLEMTDIAALSAAVAREAKAARGGGSVTVEIGPLPPAFCDRAMIRQALHNLMDNAVKFTSRCDNALIEMGGEAGENENVYWIRDNGAGFDMRYVHKLFCVFERLHGPDEFNGTGIGLAMVKRIVERHGGRVWAEGSVGKGAVVYFALPNKAGTAAPALVPALASNGQPPA